MFIYPLIVKRQLTQYFSFLMVYANRLYVEYSLFVVYTPVVYKINCPVEDFELLKSYYIGQIHNSFNRRMTEHLKMVQVWGPIWYAE